MGNLLVKRCVPELVLHGHRHCFAVEISFRIREVSVFYVNDGIDSGPIILQRRIQLDSLNQSQLIKKSKSIGMDLIAEAISIIKNNKLSLIPNLDEDSSYYSFPTRSDIKDFLAKGNKFF